MRDLANLFGALADPTRLQMLALISRYGELCVCDFVVALAITQSKASRHLRTLWNAGLLADRRDGLWVYYRLAADLDPDSKALLLATRRLLGKRDLCPIDQRLQAWQARNAKAAPCCGLGPPVSRRLQNG
jgi:ArsR family transcriptional regulator